MKATVTDGIPVPVYHAEPTLARFHASDAFFRGVRGPLGSGKSVGCCAEVMSRILRQKAFMGLRRSRWAIIRNTYGELKTTTIKTWMDWYGAVTKISYGHPIMGLFVGYGRGIGADAGQEQKTQHCKGYDRFFHFFSPSMIAGGFAQSPYGKTTR